MFLCVIMKYNYAIKAEMETTMEIQMWKEILTPYDLAVEELQIKFNHIIKEYRQAGVYSPIEQVLGRVKSISSIIEKAQRRGIEIDKIQEKLFDIAGIRLICQFTEDSLQYKYNGEIPAHVKERLNAASDALITLDNEMSSIHDEIINSQTYFMVKANIVSDILSTIQNLYKVANKQVVIKIQDEFYEIFEKGDVNELSRFSRQLDIIAEDYRAQSVQ